MQIINEYTEYINRDNSEILTFNEWVILEKKRYEGKMREFESTFSKILKYGITTFLTLPIGVIGPALLFLYRHFSDSCKKKCGTAEKCYNQCYLDACNKVISQIKKDISGTNKIEDPKKKEKMVKKLQKELKIWEERANKYKARVR